MSAHIRFQRTKPNLTSYPPRERWVVDVAAYKDARPALHTHLVTRRV